MDRDKCGFEYFQINYFWRITGSNNSVIVTFYDMLIYISIYKICTIYADIFKIITKEHNIPEEK